MSNSFPGVHRKAEDEDDDENAEAKIAGTEEATGTGEVKAGEDELIVAVPLESSTCLVFSCAMLIAAVGAEAGIINIPGNRSDVVGLLGVARPLAGEDDKTVAVLDNGVVEEAEDIEDDALNIDKLDICSTSDTERRTPSRTPPTNSMMEFMVN